MFTTAVVQTMSVKLKPFLIAIRECIDGLYRKMIWLEVYNTNNDPKIIAGYFMDALINADGCPARFKLDLGTDNVAKMQWFLYFSENQYETDSVTFGPST